MFHTFSPESKRRERIAIIITRFLIGKFLLLVTQFVWIWSYPPPPPPPSGESEFPCWDSDHWLQLGWIILAIGFSLFYQFIV